MDLRCHALFLFVAQPLVTVILHLLLLLSSHIAAATLLLPVVQWRRGAEALCWTWTRLARNRQVISSSPGEVRRKRGGGARGCMQGFSVQVLEPC